MTIEEFRKYLNDLMTHGAPISLKSLINTAFSIEDATAIGIGYHSAASKKSMAKYIKEESINYLDGWISTADGLRIYNCIDIRLYYRKKRYMRSTIYMVYRR